MIALYNKEPGKFEDRAGKGFSYQGRLSQPPFYDDCAQPAPVLNFLTNERLMKGYFNIVIVTTFGNSCCNFTKCFQMPLTIDVVRRYIEQTNAIVVTVDGNDIQGCHTDFQDQLPRVDLHFLREADPEPFMREEWDENQRRDVEVLTS